MFKKRLTALFSPEGARDAGTHFLRAFGLLWLFTESAAFFLKKTSTVIDDYRLEIFSVVIASSLLWAAYSAFPPITFIKKYRASNVEIELRTGDLFEQESSIAFGCSDCFDTDPDVIGPTSLMAQLARRSFAGDNTLLDQKISKSLQEHGIVGVADQAKAFGKDLRYPIGSTASIADNDRNIYLTVFSITKPDKTTKTSKEHLWLSLCELWTSVRKRGHLRSISLPIWGTGLARVPASRLSLIQVVILSFVIATREGLVSRRLTLVLSEKDYSTREMREAVELVDALDF